VLRLDPRARPRQSLEGLPHIGPPHAPRQEIVAFHRQILTVRDPSRRGCIHNLRERERELEQDQQIVGVVTTGESNSAALREVLRIRILVAPLADRPPVDVLLET